MSERGRDGSGRGWRQLVDLDGAATVVDVGGAEGTLLLGLLTAHPEVIGQLLDVPNVIPEGQRAAEKAGVQDRFTAVAGDFFKNVPAGDYYLLKWILHDWSDEECITILRNCRKAAAPGARALVIEAIVAEDGEPDYIALPDLNMLAVTNGRERSLSEFDALFAPPAGKDRHQPDPGRSTSCRSCGPSEGTAAGLPSAAAGPASPPGHPPVAGMSSPGVSAGTVLPPGGCGCSGSAAVQVSGKDNLAGQRSGGKVMALEARETKVVEVVVDHEISPGQITELIIQAGGLFGGRDCRTCGLVGVDLRLTGQDPDTDPPSGARSIVIS